MEYRVSTGLGVIATANILATKEGFERLSTEAACLKIDLTGLDQTAALATLESMRESIDAIFTNLADHDEGINASYLRHIASAVTRLAVDVRRDLAYKSAPETVVANDQTEASVTDVVTHPTSIGAGGSDSSSQQSSDAIETETEEHGQQAQQPLDEAEQHEQQPRRRRRG